MSSKGKAQAKRKRDSNDEISGEEVYEDDDIGRWSVQLEMTEGNSNKFYNLSLVKVGTGFEVRTHWGKKGTDGSSSSKPFSTFNEAEKLFRKLFREKTKNDWQGEAIFEPVDGAYVLSAHEDSDAMNDNSEDGEGADIAAGLEKFRLTPAFPIYGDEVDHEEEAKCDIRSSKAGGRPWLDDNEAWPKCQNCKNEDLAFMVQYNFSELPAGLSRRDEYPSEGLFQLFACNRGCGGGDLSRVIPPFGGSLKELAARAAQKAKSGQSKATADALEQIKTMKYGRGRLGELPKGKYTGLTKPRFITGWELGEPEYPHISELEDRSDIDLELDEENYGAVEEFNNLSMRSKVGGCLTVINDSFITKCEECQRRAVSFFAFGDGDEILPYHFADCGFMAAFGCPIHNLSNPEVRFDND